MLILNAVLIMLAVSFFLGLMIAIFAKVFEVKVDPRIVKIGEALPGYNCGACGFPGCAQYAEAIVKDGADFKKCKPGGAETVSKIDVILKEAAEAEAAKA